MADTIEVFVEKLQQEGVEAGRAEAEKIRREAEEQARQIVEQAEAKAKKILADAQTESDQVKSRGETDLKLAARDIVTQLRDTLSRVIDTVLAAAVKDQLSDADLLKQLLLQTVQQYVDADIKGEMEVSVSREMREKLAGWALEKFHPKDGSRGVSVGLHDSLNAAGFEYRITEGTIEITEAAVVELLSGMVGPRFRELVSSATGE
jgi:V/A-type H+-transporting ATPase subunit E